MNILKLERFFRIDFAQSDSIERIKVKYDKLLYSLNFRTDAEPNGFYFKRVLRSTKYTSQKSVGEMGVFREGRVNFFSIVINCTLTGM